MWKKIQSLEETIQELSKQQKQNGLCYKRAEKLDAIVSYQENIISKLKDEVIQITKINSIRRNALLSSEDNKDKDKKTEQDVHNRIGKVQSLMSPLIYGMWFPVKVRFNIIFNDI